MTVSSMLDSAGRRRSPATLPGFHAGRAPRNKGMRYPADPPTVEEIVCVLRHAGEHPHGWRLRAMIVMLWRGGLRVHEALALTERDRRGNQADEVFVAEMLDDQTRVRHRWHTRPLRHVPLPRLLSTADVGQLSPRRLCLLS